MDERAEHHTGCCRLLICVPLLSVLGAGGNKTAWAGGSLGSAGSALGLGRGSTGTRAEAGAGAGAKKRNWGYTLRWHQQPAHGTQRPPAEASPGSGGHRCVLSHCGVPRFSGSILHSRFERCVQLGGRIPSCSHCWGNRGVIRLTFCKGQALPALFLTQRVGGTLGSISYFTTATPDARSQTCWVTHSPWQVAGTGSAGTGWTGTGAGAKAKWSWD